MHSLLVLLELLWMFAKVLAESNTKSLHCASVVLLRQHFALAAPQPRVTLGPLQALRPLPGLCLAVLRCQCKAALVPELRALMML